MSVSLTRILANAGIPIAMNALVPGSGMADMFIRNAGTGIARGIVNQPGGGPQRVGGPGSPEGAMPTRKFGSTRDTVGELKSGFKDWLVDPLQAKKEKREQDRDTALAVRLGITGGEYSLTHRPAMSLIKKRTGDVQTNLMILQFRVQQFMARNLSAIASTLGVNRSKLGHEEPDPSKSWFGNLLSSIHKDLQENKVFSTLETIGKHAINIGQILNPFTLGSRAGKAAKSFGEFMQRLALGKEGYEMMKDPTKLYEKAGLKQDFQTKSINLMKINNEYQRHQLDMLFNLVGIGQRLLGFLGIDYKITKTGLAHDEFDGSLKTERQVAEAKAFREETLESTQRIAARRSIIGRIAPITSVISGSYQKIQSAVNIKKANNRDKDILSAVYKSGPDKITGITDELDDFYYRLNPTQIDWHAGANQDIADDFKERVINAMNTRNPKDRKRQRALIAAWETGGRIADAKNLTRTAYNSTRRVSNLFTNLTGSTSPDIDKGEAREKYAAYLRYGGDLGMAGINAGSINEKLLRESYESSLARRIMRAIPIFGIGAGIRQQREIAGAEVEFEEKLRNPIAQADTDELLRYGKHVGKVRTSRRGKSGGSNVLINTTTILDNISDNVIKKLIKPIYKTKFVDVDAVVIDKIKNAEYSVKLTGIGSKVIHDIQPLFTSFFAGLKGVADYLVTTLFNQMPLHGSTRTPIEVHQVAAKGGIFAGFDISDLENQIISQPTLFQYDDIQQFANGGAVEGRGRNTPAGRTKQWGTSGRGKRVGLVGEGKKINKKYNPEAIMRLEEDTDGVLGVRAVNKKKAVDEDDNVKTVAEREKDIKEKQEKIEEEKKEEKHQENEDDKKGLLQKIVDLLDPNSKINKLKDKIKKKFDEGGFSLDSIFRSISDIVPGFIKTLGAGILGGQLLKLFPDGGKQIISSMFGFVWDSIKYVGGAIWDLLKEHGPGLAKDAWNAFTEHPIIGAGLITAMFPGTVGTLISKVGVPILTKFPLAAPLVLGVGAMVYNLYESVSSAKDDQGNFDFGKFLATFFTGNDPGGGLLNGASNAIKWGLSGAAIGAVFGGIGALPGFLAGAALGGILGGIGSDTISKKLEDWKTGEMVSKFFGWKSGSFAYKMANTPFSNMFPFVGPFLLGGFGMFMDGAAIVIQKFSDIMNGAWEWLKSKLPDFLFDKTESKKQQDKIDAERTHEIKLGDTVDDLGQPVEQTIKVNKKDFEYINAAKNDEERKKREREVQTRNAKEDQWRRDADHGKKKYNIEKYIELRRKWDKEDTERNAKYSHVIDIPVTNFSGEESVFGFNDFKSTKENADQYQKLMQEKKDDEAIRFAKTVKAQHDEEDAKRKAERESELRNIEVGSSPEELRTDASRKASSAPVAIAAKIDSEAGEDNQGTGFDLKEAKTKIAEDNKKPKELKFDYSKLNRAYLNTENAYNGDLQKSALDPKKEADKPLRFDYTKYNQQAQAIPAGAEFGTTPITKENYNPPQATPLPQPTSTPAAEKATKDSENKLKETVPVSDPNGGSSIPSTSDASSSQQTSGGGNLNWIEQIISNTIQGAFKIGNAVYNLARDAYDSASSTVQRGYAAMKLGSGFNIDDIGWLSSHRESHGDRSLVAYDTDGGTSYGKYQFASKRGSESMVDFLRWAEKNGGEQGKKLHDFMAQSVGGDLYKLNTGSKTGAPVDAWKKAVSEGMVGDLDERYMKYRFYDKALANLPPDIQNMVKESKTLAQVLVSTAVQHGEGKAEGKGAPWIFQQAYKPGISVEDFIKNVYEQRKNAYHGSSQYRNSVYNRYKEEAGEALSMYMYEKNPNAGFGGLPTAGSTSPPAKVFPGAPKISQQQLDQWKISPSEKLVWPAQSEVITSPMGPRHGGKTSKGGSISSWHRGIDVRARQGDPIFAAMSGRVSGTSKSYGQVKIDHGNGWQTRYLHMSRFNVKPGENVNAGDVIGAAGGIGKGGGSVYTPHLHFETHKNGQFVDPEGVYYMYGKGGGHTTYDRHSYNGISADRQIQAKIGVGGDEDDRGSQLNKTMSKFLSSPNVSSGNSAMKLSDKTSVGGDEDYRGSRIRSSMSDYLSNKEVGGPEESAKSDNRIITELKKLQIIMLGVMKAVGKPPIAVAAPSEGSGNPKNKAVDGGGTDISADSMFNQLGGMLSNLNIATTGLGTTTA